MYINTKNVYLCFLVIRRGLWLAKMALALRTAAWGEGGVVNMHTFTPSHMNTVCPQLS